MGLTISFTPLEILSLTGFAIADPILVPIFIVSIHCNKCETDVNLRILQWPKILFGCNDTAHSLKKDCNRNYYLKRVKEI